MEESTRREVDVNELERRRLLSFLQCLPHVCFRLIIVVMAMIAIIIVVIMTIIIIIVGLGTRDVSYGQCPIFTLFTLYFG